MSGRKTKTFKVRDLISIENIVTHLQYYSLRFICYIEKVNITDCQIERKEDVLKHNKQSIEVVYQNKKEGKEKRKTFRYEILDNTDYSLLLFEDITDQAT